MHFARATAVAFGRNGALNAAKRMLTTVPALPTKALGGLEASLQENHFINCHFAEEWGGAFCLRSFLC